MPQLCSGIERWPLQMENSTTSISEINMIIQVISQHSHREASSHYCELTLCIVSKKKLERKEGQRQVHVACVVHTAVGEKDKVTLMSEETIQYPYVMLGWLISQSGSIKLCYIQKF